MGLHIPIAATVRMREESEMELSKPVVDRVREKSLLLIEGNRSETG